MSYEDRSGKVMTSYISDTVVVDKTIPVLEFDYKDYTDTENPQSAIVTITEHNFRASDIEFDVITKNIAGQSVIGNDLQQYLRNLDWTSNGDVHTATISGEFVDAIYDLTFNYKDLALNAAAEIKPEQFIVDRTAPDIAKMSVAYSNPLVDTILSAITFGYYKPTVNVTFTGYDNTAGIDYFTWSYKKENGASNSNVAEYADAKIAAVQDNTDKTKFTATVTLPKETAEQLRGSIAFVSTDKYNNSSNKLTDDNHVIVVDTIAPTMSAEYTTADNTHGEKDYYKKDLTATFTVTEANFYPEDVKIQLKKNDNDVIDITPVWTDVSTDVHVGTYTIDANDDHSNDGDYVFQVEYKDRSNNEMTSYTSGVKVIDTTKPVINVEYSNSNVINELTDTENHTRKYFASAQTATITINEHNFNPGDVNYTIVAKDVAGNELNASSLYTTSSWTSNGDNNIVTITYPGDANYTFDIAYTDLATIEADDFAEQYFTVDTSKPSDLKVTYSTSLLDTVLNAITFGFYNAKATVTISATDNITGIYSIVYTYTYGSNGRIIEVVNAREIHAVKNEYDKKYRVTKQFFPDGGMMSFLYDDEKRCVVLTERNGVKTTYFYDENYRNTETVFEDGTSEKFLYNEKNQCISKTDRLGRTQRMAYDNRGNLTQVVDSLKRRINFTYDANNNLISVSMNGKERLKNHYDVKGKLIATENCMKESLWITYDEKQHPVELTFVDGSKTMLSYDERGNISTIREANGNEVHYIYDELNRVVETRDVNNNSTKYKYDLRGKITKVINPLGDTREYTYDKAGRVTGIKDFDGFWTLSTYNAIGKIETITDKEAHVTTYGYDKMWNITSQTMPDGTIQAFKYDEDNRLSLVEYPNGGTNTYTYDSVGNRTSVTDAEGNTTAYVYDAENQLVEVIEPDGAKTKKTYDRDGNLVAVTNAMDHVTSYTYDDLGRRINRTNAEGATTSLFYNNMGQVERVCHPNGTQTFYTYDLGGRVKSVKNPDGSGEIYEYDLKGNLISRANGMEDKISFKYDALDRLVEIVNQVEGVRKFTYDAVGNLTSIIDEKGNKTTYDYSPNGNLMKVTDALGNETFYEYDAMNRLVKTLCTGANGEESQNTDFVWDVMGQIKSVTDPLGYVESYEYDKNGNMTSKTDRDGYTINFTYGSHGKIEEIVYADGKTVEMSYDALRRLNEVKDWNGITKITLDAIGRALSVTEPNGDTVGYEWGLMGEKKAVIYPNGKRAEYSYNTEMQLVSLHTERETIQYAYDEIGRLTKKILPNGIETNYHYNAMGRVDEISHIGNEFAESYKYSFDIYGNKVSAIKNRVGAEVDNGHFAYVYDELNRLTEVHQNDTLLRKYSYDAFGNRVSKANYASRMESVTSYTYNVNNQLLSEVDGTMTKDYTYDNRGNLLKVSTGADILKEFTFDATNQMTASFDLVDGQRKKATYTYNGLGHRVGQKISSLIPEYPEKKIRYTIDMTRQYYNLLQKSEGGASQTYYWDGNVVGMESNGVEKFYLQDDFGSPMHLVDIYGTSQECFAFDEFGENLSTSYNNTSQTFGFTGYQTDEVGDLYYAQARRYDASVGRFVSEDKVRGFVILPYTLNHYGYCWNNPVDFVDRDGNLPTVVIGAVIGLAAGALGEVVSQTIDGVQSGKSVLDSLLDVNPGKVVLEAGKGAVTGAVAGTGAGLLVVAGTSGVVEFGGDLLDQKVLQKKEDLDYTHAISNGLWSATTTLVVGGITNEISNVIHPEAKTGTMDYLFGRDKAKAVVKAQYNNARSSSSRAKYWNRLEKIKLQKTLGTIKYGIIETGKTIIDEIKNEIYRDEVNEDIVEEIDKKISCSVY